MGDYIGDPYPYAKFHHDTINPFRPPNIRKCASSDSASFLLVLPSAYSQDPCTDFRINTSNDVISRKDVPFGSPENHILPFNSIFPPKRKFLANF